MRRSLALGCLLLAGLAAHPALAQEARRPQRVTAMAGMDMWLRGDYATEIEASQIAPGCTGLVPSEPQFRLELETDFWLLLEVEGAGEDSSLILRGPTGAICANDMSEVDRDAQILAFALSGTYDVYVGVARSGVRNEFRLRIAEASQAEFPTVEGDRRLNLYGVSGGPLDAASSSSGCVGRISHRPNHILRLERPTRLILNAASSSDLTLVVEAADGVRCNDDGAGTLNPVVGDQFPAGLLRVWVGSHNPLVRTFYTLSVEPDTSL